MKPIYRCSKICTKHVNLPKYIYLYNVFVRYHNRNTDICIQVEYPDKNNSLATLSGLYKDRFNRGRPIFKTLSLDDTTFQRVP